MSSGNASPLQTQNKTIGKRKCAKAHFINGQRKGDSLKICGMLLIGKIMATIRNQSQESRLFWYMNEMLHSIFFLGYIHDDCLDPRDFFPRNIPAVHESMRRTFPEPFIKYMSHLPTRTPFSILLDMMEILYGTEDRIKEELTRLLKELKFPNPLHKPGSKNEEYYTLESTVICVCYSDYDSQKYYGASFSCRKGNAKKILIDVSCLNTWHEYVSHAVMSFQSGASGDGIKFPTSMKCQAFYRDWRENVYKEKRPCLNCEKLFHLPNADPNKVEHPFGNCAETECLSKLLNNDLYMHNLAMIDNHSEENLDKLRYETKARLIEHLMSAGFEVTDNFLFYSHADTRRRLM